MSAPASKQSPADQRRQYRKRHAALKQKRASRDPVLRELAENIAPRRSRFFQTEANTSGEKKEYHIINATPRIAQRTLASGMMAGITSPARRWWLPSTPDPRDASSPEAKEWLSIVEQEMRDAMAKSNIYKGLAQIYADMPVFGVGVCVIESDDVDLIRSYSVPVGEGCLATNSRGQVDTLYRETSFSVGQLVEKFELENCSQRVRELHAANNFDESIEVIHVIEPRRQYDATKGDAKNMPFSSCWYEVNGDESTGLLRESGYAENPILAPRWDVTGNDVYGTGPGDDALGDCKALQFLERLKANAVELVVDPPMVGPEDMRMAGVGLLPGDVTYTEQAGGNQLAPAKVTPTAAVTVALEAIKEHEQRINRTFFADLWLMLSEDADGGSPITAAEVRERHEEKMLQLGPVMERIESELLNPLIDRVFGICYRAGRIPPPPKQLQGKVLRAVYLSIMAQAAKTIDASGIQMLTGYALNLATRQPEVLDGFDGDAALVKMADAVGADSSVIKSPSKIAAIRMARAQQQQQQESAQAALAAAQGAKNLAGANLSGDNALGRMLGGVPAAQAGAVQ